jgi:hypothetical protein
VITLLLVGMLCAGAAQGPDCAAPVRDLTAASENERDKAARALAECWGQREVDGLVAEQLRKSVRMGNVAAAALLLLGLAADNESKALLRERQTAPRSAVKWAHNTQPVSEGLVAATARLRFAAEEARPMVLKALEKKDVAEMRFFLDAVDYVEDREVLRRMVDFLGDTRAVPNEFRRRLCDYAVPRLVRKLQLKVSFDVRDYGRYSDAQLEEARKLALAAVGG